MFISFSVTHPIGELPVVRISTKLLLIHSLKKKVCGRYTCFDSCHVFLQEHVACAVYHPLPEKTCDFSLSEKHLCNPTYRPPLWAGTTESGTCWGIPMAWTDVVCCCSVSRNRGMDRSDNCICLNHAVLVRFLGKLCGSHPSRAAGELAHESRSEICDCHWSLSVPCINCHVECTSIPQEVSQCLMIW